MLNFTQKAVLKVINDHCAFRDSCLITPSSLVAFVSNKKLTEQNVYDVLKSLENGGYIDLIKTTSKGEETYCITLNGKGRNYKEEYKKSIDAIKFRLVLALLSACVSFLVGRILLLLFT